MTARLPDHWHKSLDEARKLIATLPAQGHLDQNLKYLSQYLQSRTFKPVVWQFRHIAPGGKEWITYHDETPENHYRMADRTYCVEVVPLQAYPADPWRDLIADMCTLSFVEFDENDPLGTITRLQSQMISEALDPAISKEARDLMEGRIPLQPLSFEKKLGAIFRDSPPDTDGEAMLPPLWREPFDPTPRDWATNPPKSTGKYILYSKPVNGASEMAVGHVSVLVGGIDGPEIRTSLGFEDIGTYQMIPGQDYIYTVPRLPAIDSKWVHHKGAIYTVLGYTNLATSTGDKFPICVVYQGPGDKVWSRPIHDWYRSFTRQGDES